MALDDRIKRLVRHSTATTATIPAAVLRHKLAESRRIIGEICQEAIESGHMTEAQFHHLAHKIDAIWEPW